MARSVPAVVRALDVLEMFLDGRGSFSAPEVAAALDLPRTTTHELLATLSEREYVERLPDNAHRFRLGVRVYELGSVYADALDVVRDGQSLVDEVSARCGEACQLGLLDGRDVVYVARAGASVAAVDAAPTASTGRRAPALRTAAGRVLLAHMPRADLDRRLLGGIPAPSVAPADPMRADAAAAERLRLWRDLSAVVARGVATDLEGADAATRAVAAAVRDHAGRVVAALEIRVPTGRWEGPRSIALETLVRRAAVRASTRLGFRPPRVSDPGPGGALAGRPAATGPVTGHPGRIGSAPQGAQSVGTYSQPGGPGSGAAGHGGPASPAAAHWGPPAADVRAAGTNGSGLRGRTPDGPAVGRTGVDRTGVDRTGVGRAGADRTGADRTGADTTGPTRGHPREQVNGAQRQLAGSNGSGGHRPGVPNGVAANATGVDGQRRTSGANGSPNGSPNGARYGGAGGQEAASSTYPARRPEGVRAVDGGSGPWRPGPGGRRPDAAPATRASVPAPNGVGPRRGPDGRVRIPGALQRASTALPPGAAQAQPGPGSPPRRSPALGVGPGPRHAGLLRPATVAAAEQGGPGVTGRYEGDRTPTEGAPTGNGPHGESRIDKDPIATD